MAGGWIPSFQLGNKFRFCLSVIFIEYFRNYTNFCTLEILDLGFFDARQVLPVQLVIVAHYFFVWGMVTFSALSVHKSFVDGGAASMQCKVVWPIVTCQILGSLQKLVRVCGQVTSPNSHGGSLRTCSALTDCCWDTSFCKPSPVLNWHIVMGQTVIWIVFEGELWDEIILRHVEANVRDRPPCCTQCWQWSQCTMGLSPLDNCIREICSFAPIFQGNNCFRAKYLENNFHFWYIFGDKLKRGTSS